jgi:glycosyltransferase involved in cell wall biosynthesis
MRLDQLDGLHFPLTAMVPRVQRPPTVVTVHDIQHLIMPQFFSRAKLLYRRFAYQGSARRAERVIAVSAHVRETLLERVGLSAERVVVVHSGVDHDRFTPPPEGARREPFLLYPAFPWPHKNHGRLLEAFALLRRQHPELRLVLTGGSYPSAASLDGVDVQGFVTADELVRLYRTASATVFASLYEGFGQPLLEAMACGCPVAASDVASIPEVCGGAARLFDPYQPEAIAEAVEDVLQQGTLWASRGLARARVFSWDTTARATDDVYAGLA